MKLRRLIGATAALLLVLGLVTAITSATANASTGALTRYTVVFKATQDQNGNFQLGGNYVKYRDAAIAAVKAAGGTIVHDLSRQIATVMAESVNPNFAAQLSLSGLVEVVAQDFKWKAFPTYDEAISSGQLTVVTQQDPPCRPGDVGCPAPDPQADVLEALQWNMEMIHAPEAHLTQAGVRAVEVGILDTGIDGTHADFVDLDGSNVNCVKGRDFIPLGPGVDPVPGPFDACVDNNFHGTHVAGIVAARKQGHGVIGVAPNVELIPVKVCDAVGYCYSSSTAAGITYSGDAKFEVINMSFFVDDDQLLQSHEFKCMSDPVQRAFRRANERAIQYARNQGVLPVAALGNSNNDLAHPPEPYENECEVVPAETQGVVGTMSVGPSSEKAYFSNYGNFATDVAAPGGNSRNPRGEIPGPCGTQVLSTIPGNVWGCFQGTSMASPHAAGVSALIVSQFGRLGNDAGEPDVVMRPQSVESYLQGTVLDLVWPNPDRPSKLAGQGYDPCFGHGRIDALRAVLKDTSDEDFIVAEPPVVSGCPTFR
ncbi:MAG: S8 family serine peptidase [Actinomycetota bacterium]|nr:S8 family serine peptidase [Actinomycetota bacterium]